MLDTPRSRYTRSARTPSSISSARPSTNEARRKRVAQLTSAASSANRSSATGSRSMPISDQARVPAAADRAVDGGLAGLGIEHVDQLAGEDRDVQRGHVQQDGHLLGRQPGGDLGD